MISPASLKFSLVMIATMSLWLVYKDCINAFIASNLTLPCTMGCLAMTKETYVRILKERDKEADSQIVKPTAISEHTKASRIVSRKEELFAILTYVRKQSYYGLGFICPKKEIR